MDELPEVTFTIVEEKQKIRMHIFPTRDVVEDGVEIPLHETVVNAFVVPERGSWPYYREERLVLITTNKA